MKVSELLEKFSYSIDCVFNKITEDGREFELEKLIGDYYDLPKNDYYIDIDYTEEYSEELDEDILVSYDVLITVDEILESEVKELAMLGNQLLIAI